MGANISNQSLEQYVQNNVNFKQFLQQNTNINSNDVSTITLNQDAKIDNSKCPGGGAWNLNCKGSYRRKNL